VAVVGDPSRLTSGGYNSDDCRDLQLTDNRLAIGLGAFRRQLRHVPGSLR